MKPLDPRLVRRAHSVRLPLGLNVGIGILQTAAVVAQASLLAQVIANAVTRHASLNHEGGRLLALLLVVGARAGLTYGAEIVGRASATRVKSELRGQLLERAVSSSPSRLAAGRTGELAVLAGRGLDALDAYFSLYLPQLVLAAIVPPVLVIVAASRDLASAVVLVVTVALIPLFLVLVGLTTRDRTERQWRALSRLGAHLLDVIEGLPTLRIFGRAGHQRAVISEMAEEHRLATMGVLRLAFTSSLVTELIATIGTAIVAVTVGLRVLDGALDLRTALFVLLLAPEAYMPVRAVGAAFHASAEGATAAQHALDLLDEPPTPRPATPASVPPGPWTIRMDGVSLTWPDRPSPALDHVDLVIGPGEHLAVVGPSGAGKSTLLALLLGFVRPTRGLVSVGGVDLDRVDIDEWRRHIAWVPQRPHLFAAPIADNIRLGRPAADDDAVRAAARAAGALSFIDRLPLGLCTPVGDGGARLSGGEVQRIALARAFLRDAPVVLLDEPTASLDAETEREVLTALEALIEGRIAIIVTHREPPTTLADTVVALDRGCLSSWPGTSCLAQT